MDLKDYREMPDEGLFEKIERRVRLRRVARVTGMVLAVAVVAGVALWGVAGGWRSTAGDPLAQTSQAGIVQDNVLNGTAGAVAEVGGRNPELESKAGAVGLADGTPQRRESEGATQVDGGSPATENLEPRTANQAVKSEKAVANEVAVAEPVAQRQEQGTVTTATKPLNTETSPRTEETATVNTAAVTAKSGSPTTTATENVLWAPNIIAPMADDASNRVFKVQSTTAVSHFQLVIYNRGGRKVFSTDNIEQGWDATYRGSLLPQGAYVWVARFRDAEGVLRQEKGSVVVVR